MIELPGKVPNVLWGIASALGLVVLGAVKGDPAPILAAILFGPLVIGVLLLGTRKSAKNEQQYRSLMTQEGFTHHE